MPKFGRNYRLTINGFSDENPNDIVIEYPFTLSFMVDRDTNGSSMNSMSCQIYNLSEETRRAIYQDYFSMYKNYGGAVVHRTVTLEAGYGTELTTIFVGDLYDAGSFRQGTDIITTLDCRTAVLDITTTKTFETMQRGTTIGQILENLTAQFPNLYLGTNDDDPYKQVILKRAVTLEGNTNDLLNLYSSSRVFVDNNAVNLIGNNTVIKYAGLTPVIDASTGLLNTPKQTAATLVIEMLFEPSINPAQIIELVSAVNPVYNGKYKVLSVRHSGIISGAISGKCVTVLVLLINALLLGPPRETSPIITRLPEAPLVNGTDS